MEKKERESLLKALAAMAADDEGLELDEDKAKGEWLLSCMGLLHRELLRERLAEEFKVMRLPLGQPHVAYHATVRGRASATGRHAPAGKTTFRKGIAHTKHPQPDAWARVEVLAAQRGAGIFVDSTLLAARDAKGSPPVSEEVAKAFEDGVRKGLETAGPGGISIVDVTVKLLDGEGQKEEAAAAAAASAVQLAIQQADSLTMLEPVVELEVDVSAEFFETVIADLKRRHAETVYERADECVGEARIVDAEIPLRELHGYAEGLSKLTHGEGAFTFRQKRYSEMSADHAQELLAQQPVES